MLITRPPRRQSSKQGRWFELSSHHSHPFDNMDYWIFVANGNMDIKLPHQNRKALCDLETPHAWASEMNLTWSERGTKWTMESINIKHSFGMSRNLPDRLCDKSRKQNDCDFFLWQQKKSQSNLIVSIVTMSTVSQSSSNPEGIPTSITAIPEFWFLSVHFEQALTSISYLVSRMTSNRKSNELSTGASSTL